MNSPNNEKFIKDQSNKPVAVGKKGFSAVVLTTFIAVFLAELGDKTQLATLLLSAQSGKALIVFSGASLALVLSSLVGVVVGQWIARNFKPERFEFIAGVLMLGIGLWFVFGSFNYLSVIKGLS